MKIWDYLKSGNWQALSGYVLFIGMMATGYYYNLTFIQLGLIDLGERLVGLSRQQVVLQMALLALLTSLVALGTGWYMQRAGLGRSLRFKLRAALLVVLVQTGLTYAALALRNPMAFTVWIITCSLALGVGVPATFSLTSDLIPRQDRGFAAALVTGAAYLGANLLPENWTIEAFAAPLVWLMPAGALGLAWLALAPNPILKVLEYQHKLPDFALGRYIQVRADGSLYLSRTLLAMILLMFGIFFVDSLGFLRLLSTPRFMENAWQSVQIEPRLAIGIVHLVAALVAGVLYRALSERSLFFWIFGVFAMAHLTYLFQTLLPGTGNSALAAPALYAIAVSLYTVVNFTVWADLSTPDTIPLNTALGVALSGWTATFLSTAVALQWELNQMPLAQHIRIVNSMALLFFIVLLLVSLLPARRNRKEEAL